MNVENIISALQDAQTVAVVFTGTPNKTYTYKVPKSWEVKVGVITSYSIHYTKLYD